MNEEGTAAKLPPSADVEFTITLENGKYVYQALKSGERRALLHGEAWRDLTDDKFIHALAVFAGQLFALCERYEAERGEQPAEHVAPHERDPHEDPAD